MLTYLLDILGILILGLIFDAIVTAFVISILFMILQRYAGSYHAPSRKICYIGSMIMIAGNLYTFQKVTLSLEQQLLVLIFLLLIIIFLAPVECRNKRLDEKERKIYGKRAKIICVGYGILWWMFYLLKVSNYTKMIILVLFNVAFLQVIGKLDLHFFEKK